MLARVLQGLVAILLIATVNFMLVRAAPGDPVSVMAGESGASDPQYVAQLRAQFGLLAEDLDELLEVLDGMFVVAGEEAAHAALVEGLGGIVGGLRFLGAGRGRQPRRRAGDRQAHGHPLESATHHGQAG